MDTKDKYFDLLVKNRGRLNEIDLGETMGLGEDETERILAQLLTEHKVEYAPQHACNYRVIRKGR